jgi:hypothetical protein
VELENCVKEQQAQNMQVSCKLYAVVSSSTEVNNAGLSLNA